MSTFTHDLTLPGLPLASPDALCNSVPALAAPLLDETTLAETLAALAEFALPGGEAEMLHKALVAYRDSLPGNTSWLRQLWDDDYLAWREPLPLNLNYCFRLEAFSKGQDTGLAAFILALARVAALIGRAELAAEQNRSGYQAMDQARSAFYTRIPAFGADELLPVSLTARPAITVLCRGFSFLVPLCYEGNTLASSEVLEQCLTEIRAEADRLAAAGELPGPAALTTGPREQAAAIRAKLKQHALNRFSLAALEQSLLVLCLDSAEASGECFTRYLLAGPADNRWFDKSLQIIAAEDGQFGINLEHAGCDAGIWACILNTMQDLPAPADAGTIGSIPYRRLEWSIPGALRTELEALSQAFSAASAKVDFASGEFPELGRDVLKAMRTSPDAFVQVAFQLAQHHIFGKLRSSYEAVSMRGYAGGRTECARGCTQAAVTLAEAIQRKEADTVLLELYRRAERAHINRLVSCQRGQAVERYVYGLQAMYRLYGKELGIFSPPAFFSDPGWKIIKHDALSTSGMAAAGIHSFAFAPVVSDGFGIGYVPGTTSTVITATSFRGSGLKANAFIEAVSHSAACLARLLREGRAPT